MSNYFLGLWSHSLSLSLTSVLSRVLFNSAAVKVL